MIKAIVIGCSAGGVDALNLILSYLPEKFPFPTIVILHIGESKLITHAFNPPRGVALKEADEKELISSYHIYFAPSNYHLLVENNYTFSLSAEEKVLFARPSIDVTMSSMADVYGEGLLGVLLTGANEDGADGLKRIKDLGGICIVQDPQEAAYRTMPDGALKVMIPDHVLKLKKIGEYIRGLV